jgi:hypothetical protein
LTDNITVSAGTGTTIAADDIGGGVLAQRVKPVWGPDGTGNDTDVASGKALPVQVRSATGLIPIGEPTDAKNAATDTTSVSGISIWKQISASVQAIATAIAGTLTVATHAVTQSGTWTVQPGNTANTTAWKVDGSAVTQPVSSSLLTNLGVGEWETVAASATDQAMGATGAAGDYLAAVLIVPGTAAAGAVSIKDGSGSSISLFAGDGTTPLPTLAPIRVDLGIISLNGAWKVTTGTNVTAIGIGNFT